MLMFIYARSLYPVQILLHRIPNERYVLLAYQLHWQMLVIWPIGLV